MTLLYKADPERGKQWAALFATKAPDIDFRLWPDVGDPAAVRYLAAWQPPDDPVRAFPNLEVIFSVGAGIDQFDLSAVPEQIAVVRMTEPGIVEGMIEYVVQAVLTLHRDGFDYARQQAARVWQPLPVRPAASRRVGVLGLGMLGRAVLERLALFGFPCAGWSRSTHTLPGIECYAGTAELGAFLARTDILICLLPLTDATRGLLDACLFTALPQGASFISVGRGPQVVQPALLDALDRGHLQYAILDVTDPEPLPPAHPFWTHPRIRLTPHIASATRPETAVDVVLANIRLHRDGRPMTGEIDRTRGY
jgi:glyoxylate/hydroxypyruvate reductase A